MLILNSFVTITMLTSLPFPFPYTNSPSFLSSALLNHTHIHRKRIVNMHDLEEEEEEEFIDIELSPSDSRDFEFQMCSSFHVTQNLAFEEEEGKEEEYMFQWPTEVSDRLSKLTQKLKSSRAYLRSLFTKSACSDEANVSKAKVSNTKLLQRNSYEQAGNERHLRNQVSGFTMKSILEREVDDHNSCSCHRKSFSGAIKRHCSFSLKSTNGFYEISLLKSSISANSEVENSIEAAIAHCKKSQLKHCTSAASEVKKTCLVSPSIVSACGRDNGRTEISRI